MEHDDDFAYDCEEVEVVESGDDGVPEGRLDLGSDNVRCLFVVVVVCFQCGRDHIVTIALVLLRYIRIHV